MTAQPIFDRIAQDRLIDLVSDTDLLKAAAILERCTLYIGNDNGQMHIAAAMGTRTIGLFGPTPPTLYRPWGKSGNFVCSARPQPELAQIGKRIGRDVECLMAELSVDAVLTAVR
jgi:lipopolysaccharide export system permease protein